MSFILQYVQFSLPDTGFPELPTKFFATRPEAEEAAQKYILMYLLAGCGGSWGIGNRPDGVYSVHDQLFDGVRTSTFVVSEA